MSIDLHHDGKTTFLYQSHKDAQLLLYIQGNTGEYRGIEKNAGKYRGIQGKAGEYRRIQENTGGYKKIKGNTFNTRI